MDEHRELVLPDGRRLDYAVSGPPGATAIVFLHGTPGSRHHGASLHRVAAERGLRVVATSRPGYGASDARSGRKVADVVADLDAVLDELDVADCVVAGWSGGGPHALACAARLERARAVLCIAGIAPFKAAGLDWLEGMGQDNLEEFAAAVAGEDELAAYLQAQALALEGADVPGVIEALSSLLPEVDRAALNEEFGADLLASFSEGLANGIDGWLGDDLAFVSSWGFDLDEIDRPVMVWHGSEDLMVPFAHGRWLADHVPGARSHLLEGEGHLSVRTGRLAVMIDELLEAARR